MNIKKPDLVENASSAWKWFSMNIPAVNVAFLSTWVTLPEKFQNALPVPVVLGIAIALIVAGMVGRLVKQT